MNLYELTRMKTRALMATVIVCAVFVSACSNGGDSSQSAGVGGTGISVGKVTGFGSVHVNGARFITSSSQFIVDGDPTATQGNLRIGMIVRLEVETENGVFNGIALSVVYDDEIQGPVTNVIIDPTDPTQKIGTVFGQTVTFDETSTIFENTSFAGIGNEVNLVLSDVIEVSGFRASETEIIATYVRFIEDLNPESTEVELRGLIKNLAGVPPDQTFMVDGTGITVGNMTVLDVPGGVLVEDLNVEVKGFIQTNLSVLAEKIEFEDEDFGTDVDDVSLQGVIADFQGLDDFKIDGQQIDASMASLSPSNAAGLLGDGVEVEVEGDIVGGVLMADELELREGETKLKSWVSFVYPDNTGFEVNYTGLPGSIVIHTNAQTLFEDEGPLPQVPNLSVADLNIGDYVIVEGIESANEVTAEIVKRKDSMNPDDSELEGLVDAFVAETSITVLGITYSVDSDTEYEDASGTVLSTIFFDQLGVGDLVEINDEVTADGIAEEVELE